MTWVGDIIGFRVNKTAYIDSAEVTELIATEGSAIVLFTSSCMKSEQLF